MKLCVPRFGCLVQKALGAWNCVCLAALFKRLYEIVFFARAPFGPGGLVAECIEPYSEVTIVIIAVSHCFLNPALTSDELALAPVISKAENRYLSYWRSHWWFIDTLQFKWSHFEGKTISYWQRQLSGEMYASDQAPRLDALSAGHFLRPLQVPAVIPESQ